MAGLLALACISISPTAESVIVTGAMVSGSVCGSVSGVAAGVT